MACQERLLSRGRVFTLDVPERFCYSGILPGYMITSSARTFPQFLIGIVHFFAISYVDRYRDFNSAWELGNTLLYLFNLR